MTWKALLGAGAVVFAFGAWADDSTMSAGSDNSSHTTLDKALGQKEYEQDENITDLQINAESGSLSRYSVQMALGYNGPSITNIGAGQTPNPLNKAGDYRTDVSGTVGARYRFTSDDSLYLNAGVLAYFAESSQGGAMQDMYNPALEYDHTYTLWGLQSRTGVIGRMSTESYYTNQGEDAGAEVTQTMKYYLPNTNWIFGGEVTASDWFFDRGWSAQRGDSKKLSDVSFAFVPSVEYRLTHNLNFNTSYSDGIQHYRPVSNQMTFAENPSTWWVGVGWAITRDIYVNPYFSFYPTAMAWQNVQFAMSTYVSLF